MLVDRWPRVRGMRISHELVGNTALQNKNCLRIYIFAVSQVLLLKMPRKIFRNKRREYISELFRLFRDNIGQRKCPILLWERGWTGEQLCCTVGTLPKMRNARNGSKHRYHPARLTTVRILIKKICLVNNNFVRNTEKCRPFDIKHSNVVTVYK